jgi:hypothetical protein
VLGLCTEVRRAVIVDARAVRDERTVGRRRMRNTVYRKRRAYCIRCVLSYEKTQR